MWWKYRQKIMWKLGLGFGVIVSTNSSVSPMLRLLRFDFWCNKFLGQCTSKQIYLDKPLTLSLNLLPFLSLIQNSFSLSCGIGCDDRVGSVSAEMGFEEVSFKEATPGFHPRLSSTPWYKMAAGPLPSSYPARPLFGDLLFALVALFRCYW